MNYKFDEMKKLRWQREGESQWHEEKYEAFEPADNLIYFCHPLSNTRPAECKKIVVDFSTTLTTCVSSKLGSEYMDKEGLNLSTIGAYSPNAGCYDIKKYFPLKLR